MQLTDVRDYSSSGRSIFDMNLRVVFYARVSTDKDEQLNSLQNQTQYYEEYIKSNKNWTFTGSYIDEGISGTSVKKREDFLRMIEDAQNKKFDLIVTKEISRFSRNTLDSIKYTRLLKTFGVGVLFQSDNINTLDGDGELRLTIMAAIAQEEVNKLSKRVRFGFKKAQENGVILGQNNLLGYDKNGNSLVVKEDEAEIVRRVFNEYVDGKLGLRAIANKLETEGMRGKFGKPLSYPTLAGMIKNPKYKGYYAGGKYSSIDYNDQRTLKVDQENWVMFKDDRIPAIVDEDVWNKANELLTERGKCMKEHADACQHRYTYSGKIICSEHGTTYHRHVYHSKRRGDVECWNCKLYRLKGKDNGCDSPTIYSSELDDILGSIYKDMFSKKDAIIDEYLHDLEQVNSDIDYMSEIRNIEKEIDLIEKKKAKLLDLAMDGALSNAEFKSRNDGMNCSENALHSRLKEIDEAMREKKNDKDKIAQLRKLLEKQWDEHGEYNAEITGIVLNKIVVHKGTDKNHMQLDISFKFGESFSAVIDRKRNENCSITLCQMGIFNNEMIQIFKRNMSAYRGYYDAVFAVKYAIS